MDEQKLTDENAAEPGGATVLIDRTDATEAENVSEVTVDAKDAEIARLRAALRQARVRLEAVAVLSMQTFIQSSATRGIANIDAALEGK